MARVPLFGSSRSELERIGTVAVPRSFPKGVRVFHEGDSSDACYIVRTGDLRVTPRAPRTAARSRSRRSAPATSSASWRCSTAAAARRASRH